MFDLNTITKAISLVGEATAAGKTLFEEFIPLLHGADQDTLKAQYAAARGVSDGNHASLQDELRG